MDYEGAFGTLAPALRALLNMMARRCRSAAALPSFRLVFSRIEGGLSLNSPPTSERMRAVRVGFGLLTSVAMKLTPEELSPYGHQDG